jgi:hypothetical protein
MNEIESFLQKKDKIEFKFEIKSQDGKSIKTTTDLQIFANEWVNGKLHEGKMVTNHGDTIVPADKITKQAVKEKVRIEHNINELDKTNESLFILKEATGLKIEDVARLIMNENNSDVEKYIETKKGRAFLIKEDSELYSKFVHNDSYLNKIGLEEGSMSLDSVIVMQDKINHITLIVDTRNESVELVDMVSRSLTKNKTLNISEIYVDDLGTGGNHTIIDSKIFSDDKTLNEIKNKIHKIEKICEHTGTGLRIEEGGYNNSLENPIDFYNLSRILDKHPSVLIDTQKEQKPFDNNLQHLGMFKHDPKITEKITATLVTKDLIAAVGSQSKALFLKTDDEYSEILEIKEGVYLEHLFNGSPLYKNLNVITDAKFKEQNYKIIPEKDRLKHMPF